MITPLLLVDRYTREDIQRHHDHLFVFGDNFVRKGFGGQAAAARNEPNTVGIATKRFPGWEPRDFLTDEDFDEWDKETFDDWDRIYQTVDDVINGYGRSQYKTVVIPTDGIGTGLAGLPNTSPKIMAEILRRWTNLTLRVAQHITFESLSMEDSAYLTHYAQHTNPEDIDQFVNRTACSGYDDIQFWKYIYLTLRMRPFRVRIPLPQDLESIKIQNEQDIAQGIYKHVLPRKRHISVREFLH